MSRLAPRDRESIFFPCSVLQSLQVKSSLLNHDDPSLYSQRLRIDYRCVEIKSRCIRHPAMPRYLDLVSASIGHRKTRIAVLLSLLVDFLLSHMNDKTEVELYEIRVRGNLVHISAIFFDWLSAVGQIKSPGFFLSLVDIIIVHVNNDKDSSTRSSSRGALSSHLFFSRRDSRSVFRTR